MSRVPLDIQHALVASASRAPSAHNTQPARWRFHGDGDIELLEDTRRRLTLADPEGRDQRLGLGMAYEGMCIATTAVGRTLAAPRLAPCVEPPPRASGQPRSIARTRLAASCRADPLLNCVYQRATWRGRFLAAPEDRVHQLTASLESRPNMHLLTDVDDIDTFARLQDHCTRELLAREGFTEELWRWLRLTKRHPDWSRDGINADALGLNAAERGIAGALMRPAVFHRMQRAGLDGHLLAQSSIARSASLMVVVTAPISESLFDSGRRIYRLWLELEKQGWRACPMSALLDHPFGSAALRRRLALPLDREPVAVMRVGLACGTPTRSPRLPIEELVLR